MQCRDCSALTIDSVEEDMPAPAKKVGIKNRDNVPCCPDPMPLEPMREQCRDCSALTIDSVEEDVPAPSKKVGIKNRDNVPCCPDPLPAEPMLEQCRDCSARMPAKKEEEWRPSWAVGLPLCEDVEL